jgi:hypothetical protein
LCSRVLRCAQAVAGGLGSRDATKNEDFNPDYGKQLPVQGVVELGATGSIS